MNPIAIVGVSCKLPGAADVREFWAKISTASAAKTFPDIPATRWAVDAFYHPEAGLPGKIYQKTGGFLDAIENFNWELFDLSRSEALRMDPQQRLALELSWQALDMANIRQAELKGSATGVFAALSHVDQKRKLDDVIDIIHPQNGQNTYSCFVANRLSYHYDLRGPSISFDSACSSGMSALNAACRSLNDGEIDKALLGAFNLFLMPHEWISSSAAGTLSRSGFCRPFDDGADGFIRSEGGVMMLLMRAQDALAQGKDILGYVKGVALTHNGQSNGISSPSGQAVTRTMQKALKQANISRSEISLYEAHATGTLLGDAIEINAIDSLMAEPGRDPWCVLSSVKGDIGHTEAVSGLAGMLKVLLCLQKEVAFSTSHEIRPNRYIAGKMRALYLTSEIKSWSRESGVRHAAVTTLGFGGSNGVAIISGPELDGQERDHRAGDELAHRPVLILCAADLSILSAHASSCAAALEGVGDDELLHFCRAMTSRGHLHPMRLIVCANTKDHMIAQLIAFSQGEKVGGVLVHDGANASTAVSPGTVSPTAEADSAHAFSLLCSDALCKAIASSIEADAKAFWQRRTAFGKTNPLLLPVTHFGGEHCWYGPWQGN